jgi:hypothetical protein
VIIEDGTVYELPSAIILKSTCNTIDFRHEKFIIDSGCKGAYITKN